MTDILVIGAAAGVIGCFSVILAIVVPDMIRTRRQIRARIDQLANEGSGDVCPWELRSELPHRFGWAGEIEHPFHRLGE